MIHKVQPLRYRSCRLWMWGKIGRMMCDDDVSYDADRLPSRDEARMLYDSVG